MKILIAGSGRVGETLVKQLSAEGYDLTVIDKDAKLLLKMIEWNLVHVIATDTHSMDKRAPKMARAMALVEEKLGRETAERLTRNAGDVFENREIEAEEPRRPRKFLGKWR